jgi:type IV secretory pathway VirB4 component
MPILEDLQQAFEQEGDALGHDIALALDSYVHGTLQVFNGETTEDLDQRLITINIESMTSNRDDLKSLVHYVVGEVLAQRMLTNDRQKFVILDEAHVLFRNADTAAWAARLYRMAAKSNARVALITQGIRDLVGDDHLQVPGAEAAQTCIANSYFQLLLHQSDAEELAVTAHTFHLSPHEVKWLKDAASKAHQDPAAGRRGILISNLYHVPLRIRIPEAVLPWVSSDPEPTTQRKPDPLGGRRPVMPPPASSS